jgi:hypothetical protein
MPRKRTGRRRGRPQGSRQYPGDDRLCVQMATLLLADPPMKILGRGQVEGTRGGRSHG